MSLLIIISTYHSLALNLKSMTQTIPKGFGQHSAIGNKCSPNLIWMRSCIPHVEFASITTSCKGSTKGICIQYSFSSFPPGQTKNDTGHLSSTVKNHLSKLMKQTCVSRLFSGKPFCFGWMTCEFICQKTGFSLHANLFMRNSCLCNLSAPHLSAGLNWQYLQLRKCRFKPFNKAVLRV
jgi:hypothetical protein